MQVYEYTRISIFYSLYIQTTEYTELCIYNFSNIQNPKYSLPGVKFEYSNIQIFPGVKIARVEKKGGFPLPESLEETFENLRF